MAGAYSKIVSTVRQIDSIYTFIGGTRKQIDTAWTFVNGERKQVFPSTEIYTEVFAQTTPGSYSTSLGYGKYKIVISGGGGSGSMVAARKGGNIHDLSQTNGTSGQEITFYIDVPFGATKAITGKVGGGAAGSYAYAGSSAHTETAGTPGTGEHNGTSGSVVHVMTQDNDVPSENGYLAMAGGSGGGSTSFIVDSVLSNEAKGGNGGTAKCKYETGYVTPNISVAGGTGGNGGTTTGAGAAGGASKYISGNVSGQYSSAGSDGYVHIYQSNIYPN